MKKESLFLLIAEDDDDDQYLLKSTIDRHFHLWQYEFFDNGQKLIHYLETHPDVLSSVSLILLDINMPVKDGLETTRHLKNHPDYKHIPVVGFSTAYSRWIIDVFLEIGASAYFQKPTHADQFPVILSQIYQYRLTPP